MRCHVCNAEVGDGQRFCHECGQSLAGVTDATQELEAVDVDALDDASGDADRSDDTDPGATQAIEQIDGAGDGAASGGNTDAADELPATQEIPEAELPGAAAAVAPTDGPVAGSAETTDAPGRIGASLFDPATAPPDAEPNWAEPIPPLRDDMFATTVVDTSPPPEPLPAPAYESTTTLAAQPVGAEGPPTGAAPPLFDAEPDGPLLDGELQPFKLRPAFVLALLALAATVMVTLADVTDIRTDRVVPGIENRLSTLDDIGSNLVVAGFVGAGVMLVGALLQCFHLRWGAGLAGGAGLALVGWAALTIGLAEVPIDSAQRITRVPNPTGPYTLTVTRDLGYWLIVAIAGIGLLVFVLSLMAAGTGGRRGLNPWTAALGAVAALVIAAGPLITVGGANFDVNFGTDGLPAAFFAGRLGQLGLIAVTGVLGFLLVRTYGLGLAAGGVSVALWLWLSSLLEIGDRPLGIAAGNLGSTDTTPHAVTTVGVALTLLMLVVAAALAIAQRRRPA